VTERIHRYGLQLVAGDLVVTRNESLRLICYYAPPEPAALLLSRPKDGHYFDGQNDGYGEACGISQGGGGKRCKATTFDDTSEVAQGRASLKGGATRKGGLVHGKMTSDANLGDLVLPMHGRKV